MRAVYVPLNDDVWAEFYLSHAKQTGHGLEGFEGLPYQRGNGLGSFFRGLFRMILPVAKKVGKAVGKQALSTGAQIGGDVLQGENFQQSAKKRSREGVSSLADKVSQHLQQKGGMVGKRPKGQKSIKRIDLQGLEFEDENEDDDADY